MDEVGARAGRDRAGAVRGVHPRRLHHRHIRAVLPAIRADHRRRDGHLADRVADAVAGAVRAAAQAAHEHRTTAGGSGRSAASSGASTAVSTRWRSGYGWLAGRVVRIAVLMLVVYAASSPSASTNSARRRSASSRSSTAAISSSCAQLPPGASLARTDEVNRRAVEIALKTPGIAQRGEHRRLLRRHLHQCAERRRDLRGARRLREARSAIRRSRRRRSRASCLGGCRPIQEALIFVVAPPPVQGIGNAGGFRMMVEDRAGRGLAGVCRAPSTR